MFGGGQPDLARRVQQAQKVGLQGDGIVAVARAEAEGHIHVRKLPCQQRVRLCANLLHGDARHAVEHHCLRHVANLRHADQPVHRCAEGGAQQNRLRAARQMTHNVLACRQLLAGPIDPFPHDLRLCRAAQLCFANVHQPFHFSIHLHACAAQIADGLAAVERRECYHNNVSTARVIFLATVGLFMV